MKPLYEKYRPKTFEEFIGNEKIIERLRRLEQRGGLSGRAYWIAGPSGTGKTTLAYLIAGRTADPFWIDEWDATELTPSALRDLENTLNLYGGGEKKGRAVIVNEAHGLRRDTVRQLLVFLERLPSHVVFIFTTTLEGQLSFEDMDDSAPLLSRCIELRLSSQGLAPLFAQRAKQIAQAEQLDGKPLESYLNLVKKCRNNLRAVLQEIEKGTMIE
ncbi:MAG TPA: AAA family ATPase [Anaerohalosphaeraceae bacterium]|nr:AAA family ATPase [Anaerohalosphaeraceae bacterium]